MKHVILIAAFLYAFCVQLYANCSYSEFPNSLQLVAAVIVLEAGGEGELGMRAVANVIANRARGNFCPKNLQVIVTKPKQFSCINSWQSSGNWQLAINSAKAKFPKQYPYALGLAKSIASGSLRDVTHGATHYFNPKLANPSWAKSMRLTARIGNHDFWK